MKHNKGFKFTKLLFGAGFSVFLIIALVIFGNAINRSIIASTGKATDATVISYYSGEEINGIPYYRLVFEFKDKNGNIHRGETDSHYTDYELDRYQKGSTLKIKYNDKFEAVRADYSFTFELYMLILLVFGVIGIGFFVSFIIDVVHERKAKLAQSIGRETEATFVTSKSGVIVNGQPYFSMIYSYQTESGETKEVKTRSIFTERDIYFFENMLKFKIKEYKGLTAISEEVDFNKLEEKEKREKSEYKRCVYCGSLVKKNSVKCPNCGSNQFELTKDI